tara:strand:- start:1548 stop:2000 length:453 start_codon:yes stop_codon:yes gene_type:complete
MKVGKITNDNNQKPIDKRIKVRPKVFAVLMYCSGGNGSNHVTKLIGALKGSILDIKYRQDPNTASKTDPSIQNVPDDNPPPNVQLIGDTGCLHCKGGQLSVYCNGCEQWYCSNTLQESKDGNQYHTCPVHGEAMVSGTREIQADYAGKKK